jgi:hypothetical protein
VSIACTNGSTAYCKSRGSVRASACSPKLTRTRDGQSRHRALSCAGAPLSRASSTCRFCKR